VLAGRDLWGNRVGSDQPSAERQRSSSFTRIWILIIAADSRTIHSEYIGKTTGPETMLAANRLVGSLLWGQKEQINQTVIFCLIFGQIYKSVSNLSWFAVGIIFFNKLIHHFGGLFRRAKQLHSSLTIN
jgi:hypothetical protein